MIALLSPAALNTASRCIDCDAFNPHGGLLVFLVMVSLAFYLALATVGGWAVMRISKFIFAKLHRFAIPLHKDTL